MGNTESTEPRNTITQEQNTISTQRSITKKALSSAPCMDKDKMKSNDEHVSEEENTIEEVPNLSDDMFFEGQYGAMIRTIEGDTYLIKDIIGMNPLVPNPGNLRGSIIHVQGYKYKYIGNLGVMTIKNNISFDRITSINGQRIKS